MPLLMVSNPGFMESLLFSLPTHAMHVDEKKIHDFCRWPLYRTLQQDIL